MKRSSLVLLALPLALAACNRNGARAQGDFNSAGNQFGQSHLGSGFNDVGKGFSDGANATGDAISNTANKVGQSLSQ
jgi:predicted small secreted protein